MSQGRGAWARGGVALALVACGCSGEASSSGARADSGGAGSGSTADGSAGDAEPPAAEASAEAGDAGGDVEAPPVRLGWELTRDNTGLAGVGLSCSALPLYAGPHRPARGAVLREVRVEAPLDLSAGDILLDRCCVRPTTVGRGMPAITTTDFDACRGDECPSPPGPVTVRDSDIDGSALSLELGALSTGLVGIATIERTLIHHFGSGVALMNTGRQLEARIEQSYVTQLLAFGDPATTGNHSDGFTVRDFDVSARPTRRLVVRGNRFDCDSANATGALFLQTYAGDIANVSLEDNLLEGGGYQLGLEASHGHGYAGLAATNNRFSGTGYGASYRTGGPGWSTWRDNALHDPSAPDHRGQPVPQP